MTGEVTQLTYEGSPRLISGLVKELEGEGLTVTYRPPLETRSLGADAHDVVLMTIGGLTGPGLAAAIRAAVGRFRAAHPGTKIRGKHAEP